ncbi:MAG: UTP--glucose-1-phosphate uridylyltransferase [Tepidisphaerales bacterium]
MSVQLSIKAVIPAAGFGTRMLPAAKAVPKEMLPVLGKPTIQYVVEEAVAAGVRDVLMVVSRDKKAIEDHFDRSPELEARLAASNRLHLLASVESLMRQVRIHTTRQPEMKGLGDAVLQAREHVGGSPFLCLLGDTLFAPREVGDDAGDVASPPPPSVQLKEVFQRFDGRCSVIGLERVAREKVSRYGIVDAEKVEEGVYRVRSLVEKPRPENAPSDLAVAARYLLTPDIFGLLEQTRPGAGGEVQLTDALSQLAAATPVYGVVLRQRRHDIGSPEGWLATNLRLARSDPSVWASLRGVIDELLGKAT